MPRRRPSGSKAERFFGFEGRKIPVAKDEATELYEELSDGSVTEKPLTVLLGYTGDLQEGSIFTLNRLGEKRSYQVALVELEVDVHPGLGDYGQVRRRVLVVEVDGDDIMGATNAAELQPEGKP